MFTLDEIAIHHGADKNTRFHGYTPCYECWFAPWRDKPIKLLEIGVEYGASIKTWLDYFPQAQVFGIDIQNRFQTDNPRFTFILANQSNAEQMTKVAREHGPFDIVIDDGGHYGKEIMVSFDCLWPAVKSDGLYVIEDCFCLWEPIWNPGDEGRNFIKSFVDDVNWRGKAFYGGPNPTPAPPGLTPLETSIHSVTFTKGLTVLCKA